LPVKSGVHDDAQSLRKAQTEDAPIVAGVRRRRVSQPSIHFPRGYIFFDENGLDSSVDFYGARRSCRPTAGASSRGLRNHYIVPSKEYVCRVRRFSGAQKSTEGINPFSSKEIYPAEMMDGWETRRRARRARLVHPPSGFPGVIAASSVDTSFLPATILDS